MDTFFKKIRFLLDMKIGKICTRFPSSQLYFSFSLINQDSTGPKSAPVGETPSTPRKGPSSLSSPARSVERVHGAEEQKKAKPPALSVITSEATCTMSPPPAKKLALSAKKVNFLPIHSQVAPLCANL